MGLYPRPSSYPLLGPKYRLLGTIYPQLRVQGRVLEERMKNNLEATGIMGFIGGPKWCKASSMHRVTRLAGDSSAHFPFAYLKELRSSYYSPP